MKLPTTLFFYFVAVAVACGDNAYKCYGGNGADDDYKKTLACCNSVGEDTCYCFGLAENMCDMGSDSVQGFKDCCAKYSGFSTREC
jgi:hypothetical protein